MSKPAYIFDGRNILNDKLLKEIDLNIMQLVENEK